MASGRSTPADASVAQIVDVVDDGDDARIEWLTRRVPSFVDDGEVLVFVSRKRAAEATAERLRAVGVRCGALHGDMDQASRSAALRAFAKERRTASSPRTSPRGD